jgi:hypothetical protein
MSNGYLRPELTIVRLRETASTEAERLLIDALKAAIDGDEIKAMEIGVEALGEMEEESCG